MRKFIVAAFALALLVPAVSFAGQTNGPGSGSDGSHNGSSGGDKHGAHDNDSFPLPEGGSGCGGELHC